MQGKIGLEEHFAVPATALNPRGTYAETTWAELSRRLLDLHDERLALMDRHGIEMMVISLNAPAVQAIPDPAKAAEVARRANDALAEEVAKRPDRFQGLAARADAGPRSVRSTSLSARSTSSVSRACWSTASRRSAIPTARSTTTCRSTARSGPRSSSSTCRSICIRVARCRATRGFMPAILGCSARSGRSAMRRRCTRCG